MDRLSFMVRHVCRAAMCPQWASSKVVGTGHSGPNWRDFETWFTCLPEGLFLWMLTWSLAAQLIVPTRCQLSLAAEVNWTYWPSLSHGKATPCVRQEWLVSVFLWQKLHKGFHIVYTVEPYQVQTASGPLSAADKDYLHWWMQHPGPSLTTEPGTRPHRRHQWPGSWWWNFYSRHIPAMAMLQKSTQQTTHGLG